MGQANITEVAKLAIEWLDNYEAALSEAKKQRRILFLDFHKTPG